MSFEVRPIGHVASSLRTREEAPRQPDEGAPEARLVVDEEFLPALDGIRPGDRILVLTWLHRADRSTLTTHPRSDVDRAVAGVFATRSPDRPNPVGLHPVTVLAVEGGVLTVDRLEAIDGTPLLDIKPVIGEVEQR
ncbi:MAG TPA: tRNA (N6-threonylcarbamoyladenosine(37)-N6)-methyltransferase TrmO [Marmoricola sp.]|nr:tRNA (N6-threonylcarbamoyladenosine(37)-N6)-methyltransferase TrmO [Marmoricola sp.]